MIDYYIHYHTKLPKRSQQQQKISHLEKRMDNKQQTTSMNYEFINKLTRITINTKQNKSIDHVDNLHLIKWLILFCLFCFVLFVSLFIWKTFYFSHHYHKSLMKYIIIIIIKQKGNKLYPKNSMNENFVHLCLLCVFNVFWLTKLNNKTRKT